MAQRTLSGEIAQNPWENKALLREMYHDQGMSLREIGSELGCDYTTIHRKMHDFGIDRRPGGGSPEGFNHVPFRTREDGYEYWGSKTTAVLIHRLLAVHKYGLEAVSNGVVHHRNRIPWDNRPENIEVIESHREHHQVHQTMEREERRECPDGMDQQTLDV